MAMPSFSFPFTFLQLAGLIFTLIGTITSFVALATPAWQVVFARELEQWIQSGIWLNCQTRPSGMYMCVYMFSGHDYDFYTSAESINLRTPPFFAWQRTLLVVYLIGQLMAFIAVASICISLQPNMRRASAIAFTVSITIAVLLHAGATVAFAMLSQMVDYRFFTMFAVFFLSISLIIAVVQLIKLSTSKDSTQGHSMMQQYSEEPYSSGGGSSSSRQQGSYFASGGSLIDPYESQFAMRALPAIPKYR